MTDNLQPADLTDEKLAELMHETLDELRQIEVEMHKFRWRNAVDQLQTTDPDQHAKALDAEQLVHDAIHELDLVNLEEIRDKLQGNAPNLREALNRLQAAKQNLENVREVVQAVAGTLDILGRVIVAVGQLVVGRPGA